MNFDFKKKKKEKESLYDPDHLTANIWGAPVSSFEDILDEMKEYEHNNTDEAKVAPYYAAVYKNAKGYYRLRIVSLENTNSLPEMDVAGYTFIGIASEQTVIRFEYKEPADGIFIKFTITMGNSAIVQQACEDYKECILPVVVNEKTLWANGKALHEFIDLYKDYKQKENKMHTKLAVYRNFRGGFMLRPLFKHEKAVDNLTEDYLFMGYVRSNTEAEVVVIDKNDSGALHRCKVHTVGVDDLVLEMNSDAFINIQWIDCFNLEIPDDRPEVKYRQLALYNASGTYDIPPRMRKDFIEQAERYESHLERIWRQSQEEKNSLKEMAQANSDVIDYCINDVKGAMDMMANCFNNEDDDSEDAINPSYYGPKGMQPDDYSRAHNMSNMLHQTLKYMTRAGKKNPDKHIEDLDKALNCLRKEREFVLKEQEKGEKE